MHLSFAASVAVEIPIVTVGPDDTRVRLTSRGVLALKNLEYCDGVDR